MWTDHRLHLILFLFWAKRILHPDCVKSRRLDQQQLVSRLKRQRKQLPKHQEDISGFATVSSCC